MNVYITLATAVAISALAFNANAQTWQRVTPGGGGGGGASYTAWGTTSCASGYSVAYSGTAIFPVNGSGTTICSASSLNLNKEVMGSVPAWASGAKKLVGGDLYVVSDGTSVFCAVCVK